MNKIFLILVAVLTICASFVIDTYAREPIFSNEETIKIQKANQITNNEIMAKIESASAAHREALKMQEVVQREKEKNKGLLRT